MISLQGVCRSYGPASQPALDDLTLDVASGECVSVIGPSGSGKSTLLNLIAGLDRPTSGSISVLGQDLGRLNEDRLARWRSAHVGIVFQFYQLLPTLTVAENVLLPMAILGRRTDRTRKVMRLLELTGVPHLANRLPGELSGGERQRVAVARSLANEPPLLLADEPTGNLDGRNGERVISLLFAAWRQGTSLMLVTHEAGIAARASRCLTLGDGKILGDTGSSARVTGQWTSFVSS